MIRKVLEIRNDQGLRSRSAAQFVQVTSQFESQIFIEKDNKKINAKSIIGLLSLSITGHDSIHIMASGSDENEAIEAITELVENNLNQNAKG